jgi:hypothetical protein
MVFAARHAGKEHLGSVWRVNVAETFLRFDSVLIPAQVVAQFELLQMASS